MLEGSGKRQVLGVLSGIVAEPRAGAVERIARVLGVVRGEGGDELETAEGRAEIACFRRVVVEAVAGAVRGRITGDAGVREVDVRANGAEQLRGAWHEVTELC